MENLPVYIGITFGCVVLATLGFLFYAFYLASPDKKDFTPTIVTTFLVVWIFIISILTFNDFFLDFDSMPPRLMLIFFPNLIVIISVLSIRKTRDYLMKLPLTTLTYIHIVRVPVEIVLWWLALRNFLPWVLTFEGVNYDILSGISAPFAGVFLVGLRSKSRIGAIAWNLIALGLVINIVVRAIWATPYFFDPTIYEVPNIAVFYFPFVLLPGFVVPVVIFCHLVSLVNLFTISDEEHY
jgi:hypothetical protein